MPARRIFVKRAAGTTLVFGAGIIGASAETYTHSGTTCQMETKTLTVPVSGYYTECKVTGCSTGNNCGFTCSGGQGGPMNRNGTWYC